MMRPISAVLWGLVDLLVLCLREEDLTPERMTGAVVWALAAILVACCLYGWLAMLRVMLYGI